MAVPSSPPKYSNHLYVVAGYPAAGKSASLWKSARERLPLFGPDTLSILPAPDGLRHVREDSSTRAKLKAGFWCTLRDIPNLNKKDRLPKRLILHLDLLLAYLIFRGSKKLVPNAVEIDVAFARLFAQPALRSYSRCTVVTLSTPLEEIQRRWRDRFRSGVRQDQGTILEAKDKLIMDGQLAGPVFAAIHASWGRCLASLLRSGRLAGHVQAQVPIQSELRRSPQDHR